MSIILIVDDRPTNRHFLVTLLSYGGHRLLEAADGAKAFEIMRAQQPDLIITDILMPTMDGYEFVRKVRAEPNFVNIPVIFYTATYQEREARSLAEAAGTQYVLTKPADPQAILGMVNTALGHLPAPDQPSEINTRPPLDPLQVVSTKLTAKMGELHDLGSRLEALVELVLKIGSEREPGRLLEIACDAARVIIGAEYAAIGMLDEDGQTLKHFVTSGLDLETVARIGSPPTGKGVLGKLLGEGQPLRLPDIRADPDAVGFPPGHPPMRSFLGVPLASPTGLYGRLYLTEKIGDSEFSEEDQRVAVALGAQVAVAYENAYRYDEIQRHAANLQLEMTERRKAEAKIENQLQRLSALRAIDLAITSSFDLRVTLEVILQQIITQLRVDAAAILLFNETSNRLEFASGQGFLGQGITRLRLGLGENYAGQAALERRLIHIPDLSRAERPFTKAELIADEGFVSFFAMPLVAKAKLKGVLELFHRSLLSADLEWQDFFQTLAGQTAIAIDNAELFNNLQRSNSDLILSYDATIEGWSRALDLRDKETEGHTLRVTDMTMILARDFGFTEEELLRIRWGALLHDIGKMGVPDHILLKPEPLTQEEQVVMQKHPQYAYDLLQPIAFLQSALDIPYCHHEKWDGTGYPRGLKGEEIPMAARLFAIVDVWDALTSDRPYRPAWSREETRAHIQEQSGKYFDPRVVELFFRGIK
ncbi:MAG TPA: HD domain-containing phosphohydrolase [Anaerolineales bacterium]|nr:HD domain-containing phosphohydrolase [Anaerolineales bacterium]